MFILTLKGRPKGKLEETQFGHTHVPTARANRQRLLNRAGATVVILATFCLALPLAQADDGAFLADGTTFVVDDPVLSPPANVGAYEGDATGTEEDAGEDFNTANERVLPVGTEVKFDIPTGAIRTPLFGAQETRHFKKALGLHGVLHNKTMKFYFYAFRQNPKIRKT